MRKIFKMLSDSVNMTSFDTIVVGCGSAGVTAATTLARAGRRVLALEAQDRLGGRVRTVPFGDGLVELGAEWIHGQEKNRPYELAMKNNVPLKTQEIDFDMYCSNGAHYDKDVQDFIENIVNQAFVQLEFPPDKPIPVGEHLTDKVTQYIRENNQKLYENKEFVRQILEFLNLLTNNYCATNDWNDNTSWMKYDHLEGHQHNSWHKFGYKTFFDILLNTHNHGPGLPTLEIKLNTEVNSIMWPQEPTHQVIVQCQDGTVYMADTVIVTVSLGVLKEKYNTLFSPRLPERKIRAIEHIPMGIMDKIILSFETAWWPNNSSFIGFLWREEDKKRVSKDDNWITRIFGASSTLGAKNAMVLWTSGDVAELVETLPEEKVKSKCVELLQKFLGANYVIPGPTQILRSTWYSNPYTRGSYSYDNHTNIVTHPTARADLAEPLTDGERPRVLFAGEATDETHYSTVHGASDSGYREAARILKVGSKL